MGNEDEEERGQQEDTEGDKGEGVRLGDPQDPSRNARGGPVITIGPLVYAIVRSLIWVCVLVVPAFLLPAFREPRSGCRVSVLSSFECPLAWTFVCS